MSTELKTRWVEALRSGDYEQGRGGLRPKEDSYCCLGVLCDIIDNTKWRKTSFGFCYSDDYSTVILPSAVAKRLDISDEQQLKLWNMNDIEEASFEQIADYIEANV